MKKLFLIVLSFFVLSTVSSCVSTLSGWKVASLEKCSEFEQSNKNVELLLDIAKGLKIEGKISGDELIAIDQDAALYSKRLKDLCSFFINERISFHEYNESVKAANSDYEKLRTSVLQKK